MRRNPLGPASHHLPSIIPSSITSALLNNRPLGPSKRNLEDIVRCRGLIHNEAIRIHALYSGAQSNSVMTLKLPRTPRSIAPSCTETEVGYSPRGYIPGDVDRGAISVAHRVRLRTPVADRARL
jgi:hypothetical protein